MIPRSDLPSRLPELAALVRAAGEAVLAVRARGFAVETKDDDSPVTAADRQAEHILADGLARIAPGIPVVAEEAAAAGNIPDVSASFWLVDPVDGTKEFVQGSGEFTVNVALVECGRPVLGLVLAPALGRLFTGVAGQGAWVEDAAGRRAITTRAVPDAGLTVVGSRWHGDATAVDAFLAGRRVAERTTVGSSLKLCLLAEGAADVYPRFGRTMEWDIAAGDAVLRAAGGLVATLDGAPLRYGKPGFENPDFVAWGRAADATG
ncbi:MAG TPA: 3'(2'),5'-bisphosphate nucleotidase CysQ [Burkholderiaceae bacterium]